MIDQLWDVLQGNRLKGAVILKENGSIEDQIVQIRSALKSDENVDRERMRRDLKLLEAGNLGEKQILYELKNSRIPMLVIRDLYLVHGEQSAQIDFLIMTRSTFYLLECKNLYGNVEVNAQGDFIRTVYDGKGKYRKEGIYSPITQNQRHLKVLKDMRLSDINNPLRKILFSTSFESCHVPLVVLTNPRTVINLRYAKKEIRNQVIRSDQLVEILRQREQNRPHDLSDRDLERLGQYFLSRHQEREWNVLEKYRLKPKEVIDDHHPLYQALRSYRLAMCRKEKVEAYRIFTNHQMLQIIRLRPSTPEQLTQIEGFRQDQIERYGADVLRILSLVK